MTQVDLAEAARGGRTFPSGWCERLYERAKSEQWQIDRDMRWQDFRIEAFPASVRRSMARLYSQIYYGEVLALSMTARMVDRVPHLWTKMFGATQLADETRHVEFFSRLLPMLGDLDPVGQPLRDLAEELDASTSPDDVLLGTQVVLEGYAQCLFLEGAQLGTEVAHRRIRLPGSVDPGVFLGDVSNYIGRDESRHIAFGVLYLRDRWGQLSGHERTRLQDLGQRLSHIMDRAISEASNDLKQLGLKPEALLTRVRSTQQSHFRHIGFDI